jgi:hypothetical protein
MLVSHLLNNPRTTSLHNPSVPLSRDNYGPKRGVGAFIRFLDILSCQKRPQGRFRLRITKSTRPDRRDVFPASQEVQGLRRLAGVWSSVA